MRTAKPIRLVGSILWIGWLALVSQTAREALGQQVLGLQENWLQSLVPADANCCHLDPEDQLWVVTTRHLPEGCACDSDGLPPFQVMRFADCQWRACEWSDLVEECAANTSLPTVVYAHGNFTDFGWSLRRGCQVYRNLLGDDCEAQGVRMILWSWQSEREALPPCDFFIKSDRALREGRRFCQAMQELSLERPVVAGYSLGVQVVLSAIVCHDHCPDRSRWRVAFIAPVVDWSFPPCLCQSPSFDDRVESMILFSNRCDRVLKSAKRANRARQRGHPFDQYDLAATLSRLATDFRQYELSGEAGGKHAVVHYTSQPTVRLMFRELLNQPQP